MSKRTYFPELKPLGLALGTIVANTVRASGPDPRRGTLNDPTLDDRLEKQARRAARARKGQS